MKMSNHDSFSLFSSVRSVRELLERKAKEVGSDGKGELVAGLQEIETLWQELRTRADELASERQRYSEFFEYAPDAYLVTDAHGTVREANRAAAELLGVPARALTGKPLLVYVAEPERHDFRARLTRVGAQPDQEVSTWRGALAPRGRQIRVEFRVRAMPVPGGDREALCWLVRRVD
jgi:PAS domain S-box-containing protein